MDGGLNKIEEMLSTNDILKDNIHYTDIGMFYPETHPYDFIRIHYSADLANYLENEFSPEMLDDLTYDISPLVRQQIKNIPDNWYKHYSLVETAGLCYKLKNEPEIRILNMTLHLLKFGIMNNR